MEAKRNPHDDSENAILLALKRNTKPITADELYSIVQPFFSTRKQFSGKMGGMTKARTVTTRRDGKTRFYSIPSGEDAPAKRSARPIFKDPVPRIDELYTRRAQAMVSAMREKKVKPSVRNNLDKNEGA